MRKKVELLNFIKKKKRKMENKLFTQEAVHTALRLCALGSLTLVDPKKLTEDIVSLPEDLGKMVLASIVAGHVTLSMSRASRAKDSLEKEVLEAIKKSQKNEEENSKN